MQQCNTAQLFDLEHTAAKSYLQQFEYPWQALDGISNFILQLGSQLSQEEYHHPAPDVWIAKSAKVAPTASISGPCIIQANAEVRHCAFIRGSALVGEGAVVGNSTELKNCILFNGAQVPHFNYVGDSILGYKAHMGAGAVTSNLKSDKTLVTIRHKGQTLETGRKKFGAMVGDECEVGCNSVLCPGTVLGKHSQIYPTSCVRGVVEQNHIYKSAQQIVERV